MNEEEKVVAQNAPEEKKEVKKYTENDWRMDMDIILIQMNDVRNSIEKLEEKPEVDVLDINLSDGIRMDDRLRGMLIDTLYAYLGYLLDVAYLRMVHIDSDFDYVRELEADL